MEIDSTELGVTIKRGIPRKGIQLQNVSVTSQNINIVLEAAMTAIKIFPVLLAGTLPGGSKLPPLVTTWQAELFTTYVFQELSSHQAPFWKSCGFSHKLCHWRATPWSITSCTCQLTDYPGWHLYPHGVWQAKLHNQCMAGWDPGKVWRTQRPCFFLCQACFPGRMCTGGNTRAGPLGHYISHCQ